MASLGTPSGFPLGSVFTAPSTASAIIDFRIISIGKGRGERSGQKAVSYGADGGRIGAGAIVLLTFIYSLLHDTAVPETATRNCRSANKASFFFSAKSLYFGGMRRVFSHLFPD